MKIHKKLILIQLICICSICYSQFSGGSGTLVDPYQVATAEDLNNIRDYLTSNYIQTADIDLGISPWNEGEGWEPIGNLDSIFYGIYDGNNYMVSNLKINKPKSEFLGLFGQTADGEVKNLKLINIEITSLSAMYVGALIGYARSNVTNCSSTGIIQGGIYTGGLLGSSGFSVISDCYSNADVTSDSTKVGGLIGYSVNNIINSYATGTVRGSSEVGGLIGYFFDGG